MKLRPIYDSIILRREEAASVTKGGLHLPETGRDQPARGEVLAVGDGDPLPDGTFRKMPVKVGDRVIFRKYAAMDTTVGDDSITIVRTADIIAVVEHTSSKRSWREVFNLRPDWTGLLTFVDARHEEYKAKNKDDVAKIAEIEAAFEEAKREIS